MCRFGACPGRAGPVSRVTAFHHAANPFCTRPLRHYLIGPVPSRDQRRRSDSNCAHPSAVAWSGRVRHVECRAWRIIGRAGDSGPASATADRGAAAALLVPDRRQQVLRELGPVSVRARGTSRRPFRGRRPRGGFRVLRYRGAGGRDTRQRGPGHSQSAVCHPPCADLRGDRDRRRAVRVPRAPRRCDIRRLDPRRRRSAITSAARSYGGRGSGSALRQAGGPRTLAGFPTADRHPGGHRRRRELRSDQ